MGFQPIDLNDLPQSDIELIEKAIMAKNFSYSPYSKFRVGSALLTETGEIYTGCNIENISFSPTICAERTAIFKAISEGRMKFRKIVVAVDDKNFCTPCGVCRQVLSEFCDRNLEVFLVNGERKVVKTDFGSIFPGVFQPESSIGKN
ncbi:MAG: cytidine deaminase [Methanobacteriota archaeon]|nr:MAG: cytidine deaminase [Euryarchaeota archaeon]